MVMAVIAVIVWRFSTNFQNATNVINFTQFMAAVSSQQIASVTLTGKLSQSVRFKVRASTTDGDKIETYKDYQ